MVYTIYTIAMGQIKLDQHSSSSCKGTSGLLHIMNQSQWILLF